MADDFNYYDDLGKKWGMSESGIAEDAAILSPRRKLSNGMQPPTSTALSADLFGVEPDDYEEESINKWVTGNESGNNGASSKPVPTVKNRNNQDLSGVVSAVKSLKTKKEVNNYHLHLPLQ